MTEVMFYHLERHGLEAVLPKLLEKSLERGWRAVVQAGSKDRVDALNAALWTYRDDSFLPHGRAQDGDADAQPVYLTDGAETPNGARIRFLVDGARCSTLNDYDRVVFVFDGGDPQAVSQAREDWKAAKSAGVELTYWQQDTSGRWVRKA